MAGCAAALRSPAPAASTFCTIGLGGSRVQPPSNRTQTMKGRKNSLIPTSLTGLVAPSIPCAPAKCEEFLGCRFACGLTLDLGRLKRLLALQIGQHQLPELHDLLHLLLGDLVRHLEGLHPPVRGLRHNPKAIQHRLFAL